MSLQPCSALYTLFQMFRFFSSPLDFTTGPHYPRTSLGAPFSSFPSSFLGSCRGPSFVCLYFVFSRMLDKWNQTVCNTLCLAHFTGHNAFESPTLLHASVVHPFLLLISVHCRDKPQFGHLPIGHLDGFQLLTIIHKAAINIQGHSICVDLYLQDIHKMRTSQGTLVFLH